MDPTPITLFVLMIGFAITVRLIAGAFDGDRIRAHASKNGWTVLSQSWDPMGPGWFGSQGSRIYHVRYRDAQGSEREAHIKTSALGGVYVTEDRVVKGPVDAGPASEPPRLGPTGQGKLEDENARLRRRIAELEREKGR